MILKLGNFLSIKFNIVSMGADFLSKDVVSYSSMLNFTIGLERGGQMNSLHYNQEKLYTPLYFDHTIGMI